MKAILSSLLVAIVASAGCKDAPAPATTAAAIPVYTLRDTSAYENLISSGRYALLYRGETFIDSVDVAFGVQTVGRDSVLFLPIRSDSATGGVATSITEHLLFDGTTRTPINDLVPHFDSHFSSPAVLAGALYYWGLFQANGIDSVQAVRYEFARHRLNANPLPAKPPGTDDRFYFTPPYLDGKEFVFKAPSGEWRFRTPKQRR
ncbi:MAG: hypothetical protein ABIS27_05145 [Longimicrobiales bacterium]